MGFYALAIAIVFAAVVGAGAVGYAKGSASRNDEIAGYQAAISTAEARAKDYKAASDAAANSARVVYRDRVTTIVQEAQAAERIVEVVKREVDPNCTLPASFRELWDGKPSGSGEAQPASGANVPLADLAETAAEARKRFEENRAKLDALQSYIAKIEEAK
jgi:hypothetical protein